MRCCAYFKLYIDHDAQPEQKITRNCETELRQTVLPNANL
jgi:hypothetical protein